MAIDLALASTLGATLFSGLLAGSSATAIPDYIGALLTIAHSAVTAKAAPLNFLQKKTPENDEGSLRNILDSFSRWQLLRCSLQVCSFAAFAWTMPMFAER